MSFLEIGSFMQSLMLAAKARGLDTCAQGAWNNYWTATRRVLGVSPDEYIICGISLGYADDASPVNSIVSERKPLRSEEHTSELQSLMRLSYAVISLNKNKKQTSHHHKP